MLRKSSHRQAPAHQQELHPTPDTRQVAIDEATSRYRNLAAKAGSEAAKRVFEAKAAEAAANASKAYEAAQAFTAEHLPGVLHNLTRFQEQKQPVGLILTLDEPITQDLVQATREAAGVDPEQLKQFVGKVILPEFLMPTLNISSPEVNAYRVIDGPMAMGGILREVAIHFSNHAVSPPVEYNQMVLLALPEQQG